MSEALFVVESIVAEICVSEAVLEQRGVVVKHVYIGIERLSARAADEVIEMSEALLCSGKFLCLSLSGLRLCMGSTDRSCVGFVCSRGDALWKHFH